MARTLEDIISFEVPAGRVAFLTVEGDSATGSPTIGTSPAPFPSTESNCLRLPQTSGFSTWKSNVTSITAGDAFLVMGYFRFSRGAGWPSTNEIPFLTVHDGTVDHMDLNLIPNGAVNDLEIRDAGGTTVQTISDAFPIIDKWYRVDMLIKLQDADTPSGGVGGECRLWIIDPEDGSLVNSTVRTNQNFYTGTANMGVRFKSEGGTPPAGPTTVCVGSCIIFSGMTTPLTTDEFITDQLGNFTTFGPSPTKASATPDCDKTGGVAGLHDLDNTTTWDLAGDGLAGATNRCEYDHSGDSGGVKVDHPGSDPNVTTGASTYGGCWLWKARGAATAGDLSVFYGKETSGGFSVNISIRSETFAFDLKIVESAGGSFLPDLDRDAVIGFINDSAADAEVRLIEAWFFGCYPYPLPIREVINGGAVTGRLGRTVVA